MMSANAIKGMEIDRLNPQGRWLVAYTVAYHRDAPARLRVVASQDLGKFLQAGWLIIAEDPDPRRYQKDDPPHGEKTDPDPGKTDL